MLWRKWAPAAVSAALPGVSLRLASSESKDYYKILGVSRTATASEIKKAYRKRALETHPDQGGKKEDFAEVAEAYECLNNDEKRRVYDQYGSEAAANMNAANGMGGFGGHHTAEDIFAEFFKGRMGGFGGDMRPGPAQVQPIEVKLRLTLEEVYKGVSKKARVNRPVKCADCRGFGTKSQTKKPKCAHCDGSGHVVHQHRMGPGMVQQTVSQCSRCGGSGTMAKPEDKCPKCHGMGYRNLAQDVNIDIPPGVPANVTLIVRGEGGSMPDAEPGDLHVQVEVAPHKVFTRRGDDLLMKKEMTLSEALLGMQLSVKTLDGRHVLVKVPHDTVLHPDSVLKVTGEGMPGTNGGRGDLYVITHMKMPHKLTAQQREAITKAFGKPQEGSQTSNEKTATARVMRETAQELEDAMRGHWDAQEGGGIGGGAGGHGRGRQRSQQAECVHQ
ncbi:putative chaperone DNAJ protein [Trypanosoma rangeli]|uniref:Putative chaperone DNAJ protein n=1 Tax=Trypanosoma rangeli TaxID=5698 RepID=A0A3R7RSK6_TRYRA|nr:putative chaperone DNAJ protein [Trypanosoma rangeli]RNF12030.1 putative chaperone DNAJ protein [Trypanosoma rangeli]|eukprot:RNF12030.1 putative chaperone DNAJ protein [Trypanosoma rangeli]